MNNKLLVFLSFLFLTGCATYQIRPVETEKNVWIKVKSANIRDGPSTENRIIAGAKWNDKLIVIDERAKWYKVKLTAQSAGWIYKPLCSLEKLKGVKKVKPASRYKKSKSKGLVDWGALGDTDEEAEETLNRIFDSWGVK